MSPIPARIAAALAIALFATCAVGVPRLAAGAEPPSALPKSPARISKDSPMQSDAMRDALGVAMQAFQFAVRHPDASEADKQARANDIMSRLFQRELNEGAPDAGSQAQPSAAQDDDGG